MTRTFLVFAFFLGTAAILRVAADVAAKPPATDKPQLQIVYNDKLREAMKRFQITEADMNEMLTNYMESGKSPTITKSILNPETNLQETITLDFQGFTKEWAAAKESSANDPTSFAANDNVPQLDSRDVDSLEEQKRHLMRGMMILDAEITDLTADFESGRLTQYVYRQRMLENRQLYRTLMTQLIKVQDVIEDYRLAKATNQGAARRDFSRVITSNPTNVSVTSGTESAAAAQTQQAAQTSVSLQTDDSNSQQRLKDLEELGKRNALLKRKLLEEQDQISSSTSDVKPRDSISLNSVAGPLHFSDSILGSFQSGGPSFDQNIDLGNSQIPTGQDPDILILPMVPAEEGESLVEEPPTGIIRSQSVQSRVGAGPLTFSDLNQLGGSPIPTPSRTRQQLLLEYRQLQERKRRIYQLLRRHSMLV